MSYNTNNNNYNNNNKSNTNNSSTNNNNTVIDKTIEKPEKLAMRVKLLSFIKEKVDKNKIYICLDIEAYERNHDYLTEFGWCLFKLDKVIKEKHAIVEEYEKYRNGRYVPDNKYHYKFGESVVERLGKIYRELKNDINKADYLVGHGINNDINFLSKIGLSVSKFKKLTYTSNLNDYGLIETMDLSSAYFLTKPVGLGKSLSKIRIPTCRLHNAGNDAHYTMALFLKIIKNFDSSDPKYEKYLNWVFTKPNTSNNNTNNNNKPNNKSNNKINNNNNNTVNGNFVEDKAYVN